MPAIRSEERRGGSRGLEAYRFTKINTPKKCHLEIISERDDGHCSSTSKCNGDESESEEMVDWAKKGLLQMKYPTGAGRLAYKTKDGKRVTAHQWAVYDLVQTIPCGKVTTYKNICEQLGAGSPRSVGSALRNNPFAPAIPCHRVIASDLALGGFMGEWGTESENGSTCAKKKDMLRQEGVSFTAKGRLKNLGDLWTWL